MPDHSLAKSLEIFHLKKLRLTSKVKVKDTDPILFLKPTPALGKYAAISDLGTITIFDLISGNKLKQYKSSDKSVADILFL